MPPSAKGDGLAPAVAPLRVSADYAIAPCGQADIEHVGVLFVHGVGFQRPGETLRAWVFPIVRMLRQRRTVNRQFAGQDPVRVAYNVGVAGSQLPVVEVRIPEGGRPRTPTQHWIFTEAFWADAISPPDLRTIVTWLRQGGAAEAAEPLTEPHDPATTRPGAYPTRKSPTYESNRLLVSLFAALFLLLYQALRGIFAVLPIDAIRDRVMAPMERFLTGWAGDMRVLLFDEAQSAVVRATLANAIRALERQGCDRVIILAHSGGAVASYMTLTDPIYADLKVAQLITLGQGLNIARRLLVSTGGNDILLAEGRFFGPISTASRPIVWHDFYATEDPVANGPVRRVGSRSAPEIEGPQHAGVPAPGIAVSNTWSARGDHGGYWDNDEEFVLPVLRYLDAGLGQTSRFENNDRDASVMRRRQRVSVLAMWRQLTFSGAAAAIITGIIAGHWAYYSGTENYLIGPIDDLHEPLVELWRGLAWTWVFADPVEQLRANVFWPLALVGTLFWPTAAVAAIWSLLPQRTRWLEPWPVSRQVAVKVVAASMVVVVAVGMLVAIPALYASALSGSPIWPLVEPVWRGFFTEVIDLGLPIPAKGLVAQLLLILAVALPGAGVGWVAYRLWRRLAGFKRAGAVIAMIIAVVAVGLIAVGSVYSLLVSASYGFYVLGLGIVTIPFLLLSAIGSWCWRAWDEQERWEFRTHRSRRLGRSWDAAVWLWLVLAVIGLAMWLGLMKFGPAWSASGLAAAAIFTVLVVVVVSIQGAMNTAYTTLGAAPDVRENAFEELDGGSPAST
jgi:hypothetical protein